MTLQGSYLWSFGLDYTNFASQVSVSNGYMWVLSSDGYLQTEWRHARVSQNDLVQAIDDVLNGIIVKTTSSPSEPPPSTPPDNNPMMIPSSSPSIPDAPFQSGLEELDTVNLQNNPLFIGFLGLSAFAAIIVGINRFRS